MAFPPFRESLIKHSCPVEATLDIIGGRWKGVILYHLMMRGTIRFNELLRCVPLATRRTLTRQLRELEESGVINRHVYPQVPPKVEYSLTDLGKSLGPIITSMRDWGNEYLRQYQPDETTVG